MASGSLVLWDAIIPIAVNELSSVTTSIIISRLQQRGATNKLLSDTGIHLTRTSPVALGNAGLQILLNA